MELRPDKCTAFLPLAKGNTERENTLTQLIAEHTEYTPAGLMLLGTASDGQFSLIADGCAGSIVPEAAGRTAAAVDLLDKMTSFALPTSAKGALHQHGS